MEGEFNLGSIIIPIERIFHFVAVKVEVVVGDSGRKVSGEELSKFVFAENFKDKFGFLLVFIVPGENLPRRSAEITGVFRLNTVRRGVSDFSGNGFVVMRLTFGDLEVDNLFARESIPKKNFATIGMSAESLATRDNFLNINHIVNYNTVDN